MNQVAESKGGKLLSTKYITGAKLLWECEDGFQWEQTWGNIQQNHWCPHCAGCTKPKIEDLQKIAKENGGELISTEYLNSKQKLLWGCMCGYQWQTSWSVIRGGSWCPKCGGHLKKDIDEIRAFIQKRNGTLLTNEYINCKTPLIINCGNHIWETSYDSLRNGTWCPHCAGNIKYKIEYLQEFAQTKGGNLLSTIYNNSHQLLEWECKYGYKWFAKWTTINNQCTWCPHCAGNLKKDIEVLQRYAFNKGGNLLSTEYTNNKTKLLWECNKKNMYFLCIGITYYLDIGVASVHLH